MCIVSQRFCATPDYSMMNILIPFLWHGVGILDGLHHLPEISVQRLLDGRTGTRFNFGRQLGKDGWELHLHGNVRIRFECDGIFLHIACQSGEGCRCGGGTFSSVIDDDIVVAAASLATPAASASELVVHPHERRQTGCGACIIDHGHLVIHQTIVWVGNDLRPEPRIAFQFQSRQTQTTSLDIVHRIGCRWGCATGPFGPRCPLFQE
mmetsp:Transcript_19247/g.54584  ORF Transcript_19247/g.54584 Transcript_19247/m.54584 type:complete len:208 (+) Transcript_19247:349-972(+)